MGRYFSCLTSQKAKRQKSSTKLMKKSIIKHTLYQLSMSNVTSVSVFVNPWTFLYRVLYLGFCLSLLVPFFHLYYLDVIDLLSC